MTIVKVIMETIEFLINNWHITVPVAIGLFLIGGYREGVKQDRADAAYAAWWFSLTPEQQMHEAQLQAVREQTAALQEATRLQHQDADTARQQANENLRQQGYDGPSF